MIRQYGISVAFGIKPHWMDCRITNLPHDALRVRRRFRNDRPARAFVKTQTAITHYILAPDGDALKLILPQGINTKL